MNMFWKKTGKIDPKTLIDIRVQLHYAIQFIAATGAALAEPKADYSHTSLEWNTQLNAFVGAIIQAEKPFQVALEPVSLTSLILDEQGQKLAVFPLDGKTMEEGLSWLKGELAKLGADADKVSLLSYPPDDFPDHAIAHGTPFDASHPAARQELSDYYANTYPVLKEIVAATEGSSPIHIWPHHFDMATLVTLPGTKDGEAMSVGIGLSPGDAGYDQPYWYVTPWPYPNTENLPQLDGGGFWHTQHWVGAVLTAQKIANLTTDVQHEQVNLFLKSAVEKSKILLMEHC